MTGLEIARVYEDNARGKNEYRVLVDRLWPRGVRKESLDIDDWAKDVAPSTELRKWYGHKPERFQEFARRYRRELKHEQASEALNEIRRQAQRGHVVLLTATKDVEHSGAQVLRQVLAKP